MELVIILNALLALLVLVALVGLHAWAILTASTSRGASLEQRPAELLPLHSAYRLSEAKEAA